MPTYTYQCQKCHEPTLVYHSMSANPKVKCGSCGSARVKRMLGTGSGIIFKGSGFYETDYKTKSGGESKGDSAPKTEAKPDGKSDAKTPAKTESKADSKPAAAGKTPKATKND